jgi:tRNA dimethylallyltransferase
MAGRLSPGAVVGIVGPTASGKSVLALQLARRFDGEVVSCDALQVYRGMDVGTGKLAVGERGGVRHHLLDLVRPDQEYSAAQYMRAGSRAVREIHQRGKLPLVTGGTGLYLRALRRGLLEGPGRNEALRVRLESIVRRRGARFLHRMLGRLDAAAARRLHPHDTVRVIRALEVFFVSRRPMSELMAERRPLLEGVRWAMVGLAPPRSELLRRIEGRVTRMFEEGLVEEVEQLLAVYGGDAPAFKAIGYREVARHLRGELTLDAARELALRATRRYAKRQMTWFRREPAVAWFEGFGDDAELGRRAGDWLERSAPGSGAAEEMRHAETAP